MLKDPAKTVELIKQAMRKQAQEAHTDRCQVNISGGIDSAVVAALCCLSFGRENVLGVYQGINSSQPSLDRARLVAKRFGFKFIELNLDDVYAEIVSQVYLKLTEVNGAAPLQHNNANQVYGSLRSCLRAPIGRFCNRMFDGGLVMGTGNRDEDELLRFYQKGGDGEVDNNWIEGLFKSEVWELAAYLGVPQEVIDAKPSPDLWGNGEAHNDEDELKAMTGVSLTYGRPGKSMGTIEWVSRENEFNGCITGKNEFTKPEELGYSEEETRLILAVRRMEKMTRHKKTLAPFLARLVLVKEGCVE